MKKREPVSKIMTSQVTSLGLEKTLYDAEKLFKNNKFRHIPIVQGDDLIGMLSLTDLMRISFVDSYGDDQEPIDTAVYDLLSIDQVMVSNPVAVSPDQTIREVAEILSEREFHALPVVEGSKLVGIVTTTDLIKYLLDQY